MLNYDQFDRNEFARCTNLVSFGIYSWLLPLLDWPFIKSYKLNFEQFQTRRNIKSRSKRKEKKTIAKSTRWKSGISFIIAIGFYADSFIFYFFNRWLLLFGPFIHYYYYIVQCGGNLAKKTVVFSISFSRIIRPVRAKYDWKRQKNAVHISKCFKCYANFDRNYHEPAHKHTHITESMRRKEMCIGNKKETHRHKRQYIYLKCTGIW